MAVLALDTTFGACSVALARGDGARTTARFERMEKGHAERIVPMIGEAVAELSLPMEDVRRILVTNGPGTFTGARIGIAVARALSLATGAEVETFSSLHLLSRQARRLLADEGRGEPALAVAVDARRDEIYFQLFGADCAPLTEPLLRTPADAATLLNPVGMTAVAGSGRARLSEAAEKIGRQAVALAADLEPDARFLLELAGTGDRGPPRPLYLRAPDAKPQDGSSLAMRS